MKYTLIKSSIFDVYRDLAARNRMTLKKEMHDCAIVISATILDAKEGTREYVSMRSALDAHPGIILGHS